MKGKHHFLIVTFAVQGHINPSRQLARRLARLTGSRVTISTGLSAHIKLFNTPDQTDDETDPLISYIPYSNDVQNINSGDFFTDLKLVGSKSISQILTSLSARGRPVTCVIYTILLSWAADVARMLSIPSVAFWVQPATAFAAFYRYFHGFNGVITPNIDTPDFPVDLPGLPCLRIRDLPSFLVDRPAPVIMTAFEEMFRTIDRDDNPTVLVNTFEELEREALESIHAVKMLPVGPMVSNAPQSGDNSYMNWLDTKSDSSVVYVSFGSIATLPKEQLEEIRTGLENSGRPYLLVARNFSGEVTNGMAVEWCDQIGVLGHAAVGCFVTHCGWNSTAESMRCGVPMVMLPQWADQPTNARMVEEVWGNGVRMEVGPGGVVGAEEVVRCLEEVMGEGGEGIRRSAEMWKEKAREAVEDCGPSDWNLTAFVESLGEVDGEVVPVATDSIREIGVVSVT